jgi:hypothetical protein
LAVPELTRGGDIKLNARVMLRRLVVAISFADDARRLSNVVLTAALVMVAAAVWLWFLLAYAEWIFRH